MSFAAPTNPLGTGQVAYLAGITRPTASGTSPGPSRTRPGDMGGAGTERSAGIVGDCADLLQRSTAKFFTVDFPVDFPVDLCSGLPARCSWGCRLPAVQVAQPHQIGRRLPTLFTLPFVKIAQLRQTQHVGAALANRAMGDR